MWAKIDGSIAHHPKLLAAGPVAAWLYVCGLTFAATYGTDGFIPDAESTHVTPLDDAPAAIKRLLAAGLWHRRPGGYQIHDFLDYQPSATKIKAARLAARRRSAAYRARMEAAAAEPVATGGPGPARREQLYADIMPPADTPAQLSEAVRRRREGDDVTNGERHASRHVTRSRSEEEVEVKRESVNSLPTLSHPTADAAPAEGPRESENEATESLLAIPKPGQVERAAIQAHPLHAPLVELFGRPVDAKGWEERRDQLAWFEEEGATADDIRERAANYELVMPVAADGRVSTITLPALMRHWRRCAAPPRYVEQDEDVIRDEHGFRAAGAVAWAQRYGLTGKGFNRPGRGLEYERDTATPTGG